MMDEEEVTIAVGEQELALVRDMTRTLTKTVKTFNVYPRDNPIYQKFAAELFEKFNLFFGSADELPLDIEQYALLYKGHEVYRSEEKTDNIAMLLFADGIRQITFQKGITSGEITDFIDILRLAPKSDVSDDDDIVTLLWEKNIRNMGYTAVEDTIDDDLAVEEGLIRDILDRETSEGPAADASSLVTPAGGTFPSDTTIEALTDAELGALRDELSGMNEASLLSSAVDLFFELLLYEVSTEAFPEIVQSIGRIMDIRMRGKDIAGTIEVLTGLKIISEIYDAGSQRELTDRTISRAGSLENLRILFRTSSDNKEIGRYLNLLDYPMVPEMIQVLGELEDRKQRRLLCELLAEICKKGINALVRALDDERWYLVRNIVMILGMTKEPGAVGHLEKVLRHPDVRVRRETIRALDSIASAETGSFLLAALKDDDLAVRMASLRALRRLKNPGSFEVLRKGLSRDELRKKPFAEKKELLETAAVLGGENAFPLLSELFEKGGFFEKDDVTEIRASAAYGLGLLRTAEATALLEQEKNSKKNVLREACIKALKGA